MRLHGSRFVAPVPAILVLLAACGEAEPPAEPPAPTIGSLEFYVDSGEGAHGIRVSDDGARIELWGTASFANTDLPVPSRVEIAFEEVDGEERRCGAVWESVAGDAWTRGSPRHFHFHVEGALEPPCVRPDVASGAYLRQTFTIAVPGSEPVAARMFRIPLSLGGDGSGHGHDEAATVAANLRANPLGAEGQRPTAAQGVLDEAMEAHLDEMAALAALIPEASPTEDLTCPPGTPRPDVRIALVDLRGLAGSADGSTRVGAESYERRWITDDVVHPLQSYAGGMPARPFSLTSENRTFAVVEVSRYDLPVMGDSHLEGNTRSAVFEPGAVTGRVYVLDRSAVALRCHAAFSATNRAELRGTSQGMIYEDLQNNAISAIFDALTGIGVSAAAP